MGAEITAIEYYYPKKTLSNCDLSKIFKNYDYNKFEKKVGIKTRYIADDNETALDLACKATQKLLNKNNVKEHIDYILYCTQSPEYILPTTACIIQDRLGLNKNIGAFDFNLGCSGYTYGISFAKSLIESNQAKKVLLITSETYSKFIHPEDKTNRLIFGDAATATLIEKSKDENIKGFLFGTDGSGYDKLIIKNGGGKYKREDSPKLKTYGTDNFYTDNNIYMNGPEIFNFTSKVIPTFTNQILEKNNIEKQEINQFIFHQANAYMLNFMRKRLKVDTDRFYVDLKDGGNTVSNTIPIALKKYSQTIENSESIVLVGFGVGLSWSGGLVKINKKL